MFEYQNESLKNKEIKTKNLQAKLQKYLLISNYSILSKNCCLWNFWDYANLMGKGGGGGNEDFDRKGGWVCES
jgi:hypothetical protein